MTSRSQSQFPQANGNCASALRAGSAKKLTREVIADVRHMLRLDDDMGGFYGLMARENEFAWVAKSGRGTHASLADGF